MTDRLQRGGKDIKTTCKLRNAIQVRIGVRGGILHDFVLEDALIIEPDGKGGITISAPRDSPESPSRKQRPDGRIEKPF